MKRRTFIQGTIMASMSTYGLASLVKQPFEQAMSGLEKVVSDGLVESASIFVRHRGVAFARHYGLAKSDDAMFLLGSISKPICITALMTLFDRGEFRLDDRLSKFLP
ncbi:MAG: serine hydrolase, partial [Planctomycetes bacterium]|nr:serine hydrolase [Planctomycetota bacterium]